MKILMDTTIVGLSDGDRGGVHRYIVNLLSHLKNIDKDNDYILFFNFMHPRHRKSCKAFFDKFQGLRFDKAISLFPPPVRMGLGLPIEWFVGPIDVFHSPSHWSSPVGKAKSIVTIHDMAHLRRDSANFESEKMLESQIFRGRKFTKSVNKRDFFFKSMDKYLPETVDRSDRIITVSHKTKRDLIQAFPEAESKIRVIYEGVSDEFQPVNDQSVLTAVFNRYGISPPYILFVGILDPNKNILRLVEAFESLKRESKPSHKLVIVGRKTWYYEVMKKQVARLGVDDHVIFTGHVPEKDLATLYSGADVFVLPSYMEGFGLPVLEAMACGVPVIAADGGSLPEIVGKAALLVHPFDPASIAGALHTVISTPDLRATLREKGFERRKDFSWEKMATETLGLYQEVFAGTRCS
jgi:glycosyltransferase involved in cell wall biosynthesis